MKSRKYGQEKERKLQIREEIFLSPKLAGFLHGAGDETGAVLSGISALMTQRKRQQCGCCPLPAWHLAAGQQEWQWWQGAHPQGRAPSHPARLGCSRDGLTFTRARSGQVTATQTGTLKTNT